MAQDVLRLASLCPRGPIPLSIVAGALGTAGDHTIHAVDAADLSIAVADLTSSSTGRAMAGELEVHGLVALVARVGSTTERCAELRTQLVTTLGRFGFDEGDRALLLESIQHGMIAAHLLVEEPRRVGRAGLLHLLGSLADESGRYTDAASSFEHATEILTSLVPHDPDTLSSRGNMASSYLSAGRTDEAIALEEQTLADRERVLGPDHPDTLMTRNNLAASYFAARRAEAHEMLADGVERMVRVGHPDAEAWARELEAWRGQASNIE